MDTGTFQRGHATERRLSTPSGASETPDITGRFQNIPKDPHASAVATVPDK